LLLDNVYFLIKLDRYKFIFYSRNTTLFHPDFCDVMLDDAVIFH